MNKKIILPVVLIVLVGLVVFVSAQPRGYEQEYGAAIYKGWNLVYGFVSPEQLDGQAFDKSHIKAIYVLMPMTQEYVRLYPNPEQQKMEKIISTLGNDEFNPSITALWVYSDATVGGSLNGHNSFTEYWLERQPLPYNTNPLYKGWNFIGVTLDMYNNENPSYFTLNSIKGDCNIEKAYFYALQESPPIWAPVGLDLKLDDDFLGSGLAVKVSNKCRLGTPEGAVPSVPNLP